MPPLPFKRPLIKISGEALMGSGRYGIDIATLDAIALDIAEVCRQGIRPLSSSAAGIFSGGSRGRRAAWTASRAISWGCWPRS